LFNKDDFGITDRFCIKLTLFESVFVPRKHFRCIILHGVFAEFWIQVMLLNLEGFQWATSPDLNMGCCHVRLDPASKQLCAVVLPFGKHEHQAIPMGLCISPDIFQEKMSELMDGLAFVRTCIDDLLCLTKGAFSDHLKKAELVLQRLQKAGLEVNVSKSFFACSQLEHPARVLDCPHRNQACMRQGKGGLEDC